MFFFLSVSETKLIIYKEIIILKIQNKHMIEIHRFHEQNLIYSAIKILINTIYLNK